MPTFGKALVMLALSMVTIVYAITPQTAPIRETLTFQTVLGALGGMFVIVLLIERVTEIAISIWRQSAADAMKQEVESLSKDPLKSADLLTKSKDLSSYQAETKSLALLSFFEA